MSKFAPERHPLKTYSHLAGAGRMPSEYEIVTSNLHYYVNRGGFEVNLPLGDWYERYQRGSRVQGVDWEAFRDPRETTYTSYAALQHQKEVFVDGLLRSVESTRADSRLESEWVGELEKIFAPLRYPWHGFQMIAAYIGEMAPGGRITVAAMFQAADEMRRVQRVAYRMRQLQEKFPGFGNASRALWEQAPEWQPFRKAVETMFVAYDWAEAFVALNVCVKPLLDELLVHELGAFAKQRGDTLLAELLWSLDEDCVWARRWTKALLSLMLEARPENRDAIQAWVGRWLPLGEAALTGLSPWFRGHAAGEVARDISARHAERLRGLGIVREAAEAVAI